MDIQKIRREVLVKQLRAFFRLDPDEITPYEEVQLLYIYDCMVIWSGYSHPSEALAHIQSLEFKPTGRSKATRIYKLFRYCQSTRMTASGRYDTTTMKPPTRTAQNYHL